MPPRRDFGYRLIEDAELTSMPCRPEVAEGNASEFRLWIFELPSVLYNIDWQTWLVLGWFVALLALGGFSTMRYRAFVRRLASYQRVPNTLVDAIAVRLMISFGPRCLAWTGVNRPRFPASLPLTSRPPLPEDGERARKKYRVGNTRCYGGRTFLGFRSVSVEVIRGPIGPAVVGFWKPRIVLPECIVTTLKESELEALMLHELIHVRRGDMLWSVAQMVIDAMWWFHPMWWYARRRMNLDMEISCDEETLARTSLAPSAYARCLLQVLEQKQHLLLAPNCPGVKPVEVTQERLESMMQMRQGCHRRSPFWLNLVLLAGCFLLVPSASIGLHGLENTTAENDSKAKKATSDGNPEILSKEYDVATLLERLCKETKIEKEQAAEDLTFRLSEQPRVFSFNLPATSTAEAPPSIGARSTENLIPSDSSLKIENGTLHASGSADFHTQLQDKIDRYSKTGFASIVAEIVVLESDRGATWGFEGEGVIPVDKLGNIVAFDSAMADRLIASAQAMHSSLKIVSRPMILFQSGTSFGVCNEFKEGGFTKKLECEGKATLLDSGIFDVDFEFELCTQKIGSDGSESDDAKLPPPREILTISTCYALPSGKTLYLRHRGSKSSHPSTYMIFVKCFVPELQPAGGRQAVSTNDRSSNNRSPVQLASATLEKNPMPEVAQPVILTMKSFRRAASQSYSRTPTRDIDYQPYWFTYSMPFRTLLPNSTKTKERNEIFESLRKLGYAASIQGYLHCNVEDSHAAKPEIEFEGFGLHLEMQHKRVYRSTLLSDQGRFSLASATENTNYLDFSIFSFAEFEGNVWLSNRDQIVSATKARVEDRVVTLDGDVEIIDHRHFTAKANQVTFDGEIYTFVGNASVTKKDSSNALNVLKSDRIRFNVTTQEIQVDTVPQPK